MQSALLRIDAGSDVNILESGSVIIGESVYINGGTPEFFFRWIDEDNGEYYERTPEVYNLGMYWLTVTDEKNCTASDSLAVKSYGTGAPSVFMDETVKVFMDGTGNLLYVELRDIAGPLSLSIVTMEGKLLYSDILDGYSTEFTHQIDLSTLHHGIYLLHVQYGRIRSVKKIIVH